MKIPRINNMRNKYILYFICIISAVSIVYTAMEISLSLGSYYQRGRAKESLQKKLSLLRYMSKETGGIKGIKTLYDDNGFTVQYIEMHRVDILGRGPEYIYISTGREGDIVLTKGKGDNELKSIEMFKNNTPYISVIRRDGEEGFPSGMMVIPLRGERAGQSFLDLYLTGEFIEVIRRNKDYYK